MNEKDEGKQRKKQERQREDDTKGARMKKRQCIDRKKN